MGVPLRFSAAAPGGRRLSHYREFPPSAALSGVAQCTWEGVPGWSREIRVLPDGCADLSWDGERLLLTTGLVPVRIPLSATVNPVGLRLHCGVVGGVLGPAALSEPLPAASRTGAELREAVTSAEKRVVLERFVVRRLRDGFRPDPVLPALVRELTDPGARVGLVADRLGLSERTLRRRLHTAAGCGPKEVQRVLRFSRFVRRLGDLAAGRAELSSVAADLGYADQSHLGHECVRLSGSSPARLVAGYARHSGVAGIDQTATP
ncbi:helix-turn-helix domain-containing protein [Saccharothrix sp. AJ9571]|nr:helix-turn-helix domain-containing protein [Saccharothrix sp. AJ9571]